MRRRLGLGLGLAMILSLSLQAAGTVTASAVRADSLLQYTITWTSNGSGVVSGNAITLAGAKLLAVRIVPNSGGTQPSDQYDVTLLDGTIDLLSSQGADQSNAAGAYYSFDPPLAHDPTSTVELSITNAGSAKGGTITVWVDPN